MSQASQLSRYRPAVVAITGAAAACAIYALYTTYSSAPAKTGLRRSNAVHRPRGERSARIFFTCKRPNPEAPLGVIVASKGSFRLSFVVGSFDSMAAFETNPELDLPSDPDTRLNLDMEVVECIMQACYLARSDAQRLELEHLQLGGLNEALINGDIGAAKSLAHDLLPPMLFTGSAEAVEGGVTNFKYTELFASGEVPSGSDDSEFTIGETDDGADATNTEPSQGLKGLLYHIAKEDNERKAYEHRGIHCEECGESPIRGIRWHCLNCPDFDLCSACEVSTEHQKTHVFARIKIPLPVLSQPTKEHPLWYPGDPRKIHPPLNSNLKKRLQAEYDFEETQMDANYDQFICIANVPWPNDPNGIKGAIDRRAFNQAFTSERWPQRFRPNALYDRMFAFYDTNKDGLIGFEEFVSGLAYLRGSKRFASLGRALQGFDIDRDGYVERRDFIRLFHAKHEIQTLLTASMIEGHENEQTQAAMETLRSSQPISSVFSMEEIPPGEDRRPAGKTMDLYGDMQPDAGTKTVLNDDEGWPDEATAQQLRSKANVPNGQPHEQLQHHLSRFEEMLNSPTSSTSDNGAAAQQNGTSADTNETSNGENGSISIDRSQGEEKRYARREPDDESDGTLNQDVLWYVVEEGFHEMLGPLFQERETTDNMVVKSRVEREKWRKEIDEVKREKEECQSELKSAAQVDPLMATALGSTDGEGLMLRREPRETGTRSVVLSEIVPTDAATLARREAEIAERPLEELLDASGYSTVDDDPETSEHEVGKSAKEDPRDASAMRALYASRVSDADNLGVALAHDPTMPQNRPDNTGDASCPSKGFLEYLGTLDELDAKIRARGGPGRLSFEEIEGMVNEDSSRELKGLVTGWLEWASF